MLTISEVIKTFYNALLQRLKKYRGNWEQNDPTADDYIKNRPFYTGGDPVETMFVEESTVSFTNSNGIYITKFSSTFEATVGETYIVTWDGAAYECTCVDADGVLAIGNLSIPGDVGADTGEPFVIAVSSGSSLGIYTKDTSASHTFSISGVIQEIVKLDKKYLPDTVATKLEVAAVQTTANNAWNTANTAKIMADNAWNTATTANTTANNAQNIANIAQTIANNAQTAVDNAKIDPVSYNYCASLFSKSGEFIGWYETMGILSYREELGSFYRSAFETTPLKYEDMPFNNFTCIEYLSAKEGRPFGKYTMFLSVVIVNKQDGSQGWSVNGVAIDNQGGTFYVKSPVIDKSTGEGLFLDFLPQNYMLINSSTSNSTKQFRITVDDSGKPTFTNSSDSTDSYTPTDLPSVTSSDSGKFLRVSSAGEWVAETIPNASGVSF